MSFSARAEYLADLSELAARIAACFCMARCAGADVKAIGPSARAAAALGASLDQMHADMPPFSEDTEYLEECESIRVAIRPHRTEVEALLREAEAMMEWASAEMWRALRDRDMPRYYMALAAWMDAHHAASVCRETMSRLDGAQRALAWAPGRYAEVYEGPVTHVSQGGVLPHEGRWITGDRLGARTAKL